MSVTAGLFVILGLWVVIGITSALAMGRRGHHPFTWGALGACLGPLVIPLAIQSLRHHQETLVDTVSRGDVGTGPLDVLIGVDGSDEAMSATRRAIELLGPSLCRVTLAAVLDHDTARSSVGSGERADARMNLERHAHEIREGCAMEPGVVLLSGQPARALLDHASSNHYDVLVIGRRGRGASRALLGSVATQISREADMPVLLVGAPPRDLDHRAGTALAQGRVRVVPACPPGSGPGGAAWAEPPDRLRP